MTLVLNDEDVAQVLSMPAAIAAVEDAYRDLARGAAVNAPRRDTFLAASHPQGYYSFKTIEGGLERLGVMAQRINSDLITYPVVEGVPRRVKVPAAPRGRYVGLVFLYSTETLELLAIMNDGHLQRMRVAATTGVGMKHLARDDARVAALFGSGWQAEAAAWALAAARPLQAIRIFSPTRDHCEALAERLQHLPIEVTTASTPDEALLDADIVATATNSQGPVVAGTQIRPGMHLTCITTVELDEGAWARADRITASATPEQYVSYRTPNPTLDRILSDRDLRDHVEARRFDEFRNKISLLSDLLVGRARGRTAPEQITLMAKTWGLGIEFAAVGKLVYERARAEGIGREIPTEWFTQTSHP